MKRREFVKTVSAVGLGIVGRRSPLLRFRGSLEAANRSYDIAIYQDAPHSWLNHRIEAWRQPRAEAAWRDLRAFLDRVHSGGYGTDRVQWSFRADTAA